jgi:hypothetical protein
MAQRRHDLGFALKRARNSFSSDKSCGSSDRHVAIKAGLVGLYTRPCRPGLMPTMRYLPIVPLIMDHS